MRPILLKHTAIKLVGLRLIVATHPVTVNIKSGMVEGLRNDVLMNGAPGWERGFTADAPS